MHWSKILVLLWIQILDLIHILKTYLGLFFITWGTFLKFRKYHSLHDAEKLVHAFVTLLLQDQITAMLFCPDAEIPLWKGSS